MNLKLSGIMAALLAASATSAEALPTTDQSVVAKGGMAFAIDLYGRLAAEPGNLFFSPYSISNALAMTYGGAAGHTAEEMAKTLHLNLPSQRLHAAFGGLDQALNEDGKKGGCSLNLANALWGQRGTAFLAPFLDLVKTNYGAGLNAVDFRNDAEGARKTINDWVADKTNGKIKDLIAPGVLKDLTRLVLTNAIYFKGRWEQEFKAQSTSEQTFRIAPGRQIRARLMEQTGNFGYFDGGTFQLLEMPYKGADLAMAALLPKDDDGLTALERALSAEALQNWLALARYGDVHVYFPRFKITEQFSLAEELKALGMVEAFDDRKADFSLMNGKQPGQADSLFISDVIHKAFVECNEEGTEAAAASAVVMMRALAMPRHSPPVFRADHPFLFLIRDRRSGAILFLGRIVEPNPAK
jgi:serpin B